jgi:hypothetical protein
MRTSPEKRLLEELCAPEKDKTAEALESLTAEELELLLRQEGLGEKTKTSASEKMIDPGWWESQKGVSRAMRRSDHGVDKLLADPKLIGERVTKGLKGAIVGAGAGGLSGAAAGIVGGNATLGALIGAAVGATIGQSAGLAMADNEYLRKKGIEPKFGGLLGNRFSREAAKKYLKKTAAPSAAIGHAMKFLSRGAGSHAAWGAGGGAALGAGAGLLRDPGTDPVTGARKSRLGNVLKGSIGGAALGAGLTAGAGAGAKALAGGKGRVGKYLQDAQAAVTKTSEAAMGAAAYRAGSALAKNRKPAVCVALREVGKGRQ